MVTDLANIPSAHAKEKKNQYLIFRDVARYFYFYPHIVIVFSFSIKPSLVGFGKHQVIQPPVNRAQLYGHIPIVPFQEDS